MVEYKKRKILFDPSTKQDKLIAGANIQITHTEGGDIISSSGGGEPIDMSAYLSKIEASSTYQVKGNYAYKGDIPSLEGYAKQTDIPSLVGYALKSEIPSLNGYAKLTDIPSLEGYAKTTEIPDISNLATKNEIPDISGKADKSTTYTKSEVDALIPEVPSLDNYAKKSDIPDVSNFATRSEIPDVSNLATKNDIPDISNLATKNEIPSLIGYATESYVQGYHDSTKQDVIDDLDDIRSGAIDGEMAYSAINNMGDIISHNASDFQPAGNYALKSEIPTIPTNVSAFNNDSGYLTQHQSIKTINGESIIGTGNIEIQGGGASIEVNYYDD